MKINKGTIIKVKKSSFGLKRNIDKNIKVISKNKNNIIIVVVRFENRMIKFKT